jgi:hypothetical protein
MSPGFDERKRNIKFYRDSIFPIGQLGLASFHQALANLATYLRLARRIDATEEYEAREEFAHQAMTIKIINEKIAKKEATGSDVIGAVAALACHAVSLKPHSRKCCHISASIPEMWNQS